MGDTPFRIPFPTTFPDPLPNQWWRGGPWNRLYAIKEVLVDHPDIRTPQHVTHWGKDEVVFRMLMLEGGVAVEGRTSRGLLHNCGSRMARLFRCPNGSRFAESWRHGELHNESGPAQYWVSRTPNGIYRWYLYGLELPSGEALEVRQEALRKSVWSPSCIFEWSYSGVRFKETFLDGAMTHLECWQEEGDFRLEKHYRNGILHREKEHAVKLFQGQEALYAAPYHEGLLEGIGWSFHDPYAPFHGGVRVPNLIHHKSSPLLEQGTMVWRLLNGKKHRVGGPAEIHHSKDGRNFEKWSIHDKLHREDGPALVSWEGEDFNFSWYKDGKRHREDGPATFEKIGDNLIYAYWKNGQPHREDGPAEIHECGGKIIFETWCIQGRNHREDGPAETALVNVEGGPSNCTRMIWRREGRPFREGDLPTEEIYYANGQPYRRSWMRSKHEFHREASLGPALIIWDENGEVVRQVWVVENVLIKEEGDPSHTRWDLSLLDDALPDGLSDPLDPPKAKTGPLALATGKAFIDVAEAILRRMLPIPESAWERPAVRGLFRAAIPVLLSTSGDDQWRRWMETTLTAVMVEEGFSVVRDLFTLELKEALQGAVLLEQPSTNLEEQG